ncbi:MAG: NAD(P)-dependent oxidoreductase [Acholeplasmataceae bacterium]|nr:NAD(P)-dependent oxidoreductase [Acholeplasmataceae bacterium]
MKIAWIGTGVMGKPMAGHLQKAGYEVVAYNRTFSKAKSLEPEIKVYDNLEACIKDADIIFSIVGYPSDVADIYQIIIQKAKKNAILVDMTTSSPTLAKRLYQKAKENQLYMLDAPVTGGDIGAKNQTLSIMVGGDEDIFQKVMPLFYIMGHKVTYMGSSGSGQHAKLANQTVIAGNIVGIAESLVYAESKGLDLNKMLDVISGGSASSWQAIHNGAKMIQKDYQPGFFVKHFLKDLKLIIEEKGDLSLPVLETVTQAYDVLMKMGYENLGTQAIIEYYLSKEI